MASQAFRVVLAIVTTAFIVTVVILSSYTPGVKTVTSVNTVTNTVTDVSSVTVTDTVASDSTVTVTQSQAYAFVVKPDAMVTGNAVSIPGCSVHGGCTTSAGQSSTAALVLYQGDYYYVSNYTITDSSATTVYTVWYTNSTDYCVSPPVYGAQACPNAVFVQASSSQTQTTTSTSVSCTVTGTGGPLLVQVETDQGSPVQGQEVHVVHKGPTVDGQYCGTVTEPSLFTNATGWVVVPDDSLPYAGSFVVTFVYDGQQYNATAGIAPVTTSYLTVYVPSGEVSITNCPLNSCPTSSMSMTMDG